MNPIALNPGLPNSLAASLGRMIARHAYLEFVLASSLHRIIGVDYAVGRVAVVNPRGGDILDRMQELAEIYGLAVHPFPWKEFRKTLTDLKTWRDIYAHSPWVYNKQARRYWLYITTGSRVEKPGGPSLKRKIYPEGKPIAVSDLTAFRKEIEKAIRQAHVLDRFFRLSLQVRARASPGKLP